MAAEISAPCDISIPTKDFSVPHPVTMRDGLVQAIQAMVDGQMFYVGCMGGIGRTGLFLSLMARALGEENPVEWVRANYDKRAVETEEQQRYVMDFDLGPVRGQIRRAKLMALLKFWVR
jgi:protein-tyrosine phosphatase